MSTQKPITKIKITAKMQPLSDVKLEEILSCLDRKKFPLLSYLSVKFASINTKQANKLAKPLGTAPLQRIKLKFDVIEIDPAKKIISYLERNPHLSIIEITLGNYHFNNKKDFKTFLDPHVTGELSKLLSGTQADLETLQDHCEPEVDLIQQAKTLITSSRPKITPYLPQKEIAVCESKKNKC